MTYKIKPLEWKFEPDGSSCLSCFGLISVFYIPFLKDWNISITDLDIYDSQFKSEEEAKKAAEEYYNNKLKEALTEVDDSLIEIETLVEKVKSYYSIDVFPEPDPKLVCSSATSCRAACDNILYALQNFKSKEQIIRGK